MITTIKTTGKKRQGRRKAIPKGYAFMPKVSYKQLKKACKKERPGKSQIILRVCLLRKEGVGMRNMHAFTSPAFSSVRQAE